mgnify:CR=1 FL=1
MFFTPFSRAADEQQVVVGIRQQAGSLMCVPLVNRNVLYGVLCLYQRQVDFFTSIHEQFFTLFSKLFTQMLLNFRYANDLQNQVHERTGQLEDALQAARKLQQDFRDLALLDEPTGLPNRRLKKDSDSPISVKFCTRCITRISAAT